MATLTAALNTEFTPTAGDFNAQASGGIAILERKQTSGAAFAEAGRIHNAAVVVSNPIAGAIFRFVAVTANVAVQADQ